MKERKADTVILQCLRNNPLSRADLAAATGFSERHIARIIKSQPNITERREGHRIIYLFVNPEMAEVETASSITTVFVEPRQHVKSDAEEGQRGQSGHQIAEESGKGGHFPDKINPKEPSNRDQVAERHRKSLSGASKRLGSTHFTGENANKCRSCPLSFAELERDTLQFVIVDQEFRDCLIQEATRMNWRRKSDRGLTWIYQKHLTLQVGGDVVVFYSDEPMDIGPIVKWIRVNFSMIYDDIDSLAARVKRPHELKRDELTVIITDVATIEEMRVALHLKADRTGTFYLKSPNPNIPGFKAYFYKDTLRCEFDCRDEARKISALYMRRRLLQILPHVAVAPGIFDEFLTDYYNPYEHPIVIDTGISSILQQVTTFAEITDKYVASVDKFTEILRELTQGHLVQSKQPQAADPLKGMVTEVEGADGYDLDGIVQIFATHLRLDRQAVIVFLAAWSLWAYRKFQSRVLKEDISKLLRDEAKEPLSLDDIAVAIHQLQNADLMVQADGYDVKFSPRGMTLAKKLTAKREGLQ